MLFRQLAHPRLINKEVERLRRMRHQRRVGFNRRHQMIADRPQVAAVVKLEETRPELRNVDLNRALGRAGFTGQTAGHRLLDLMREIVLSLTRVPAIAGALHQGTQAGAFFRQIFFQLIGVDAAIRQQAQPFSHQRGPPLRRVNTVVADLHRRTHRAFGIKVEAQTVAITLHRAAPRAAHGNGDLPIEGPALNRIHLHHRRIHAFRRAYFTGIQTVIRVKRGFNLAQLAKQFCPKERRAIFGAEAFPVFPPQKAAILSG